MGGAGLSPGSRARAWRDSAHERTCERIEAWEHGTVVRADRYPSYYDFNAVLVDDDPGMSAAELMAIADEALDGLEHRRVDFASAAAAEPLRADFEAAGWEHTRLLWMHHEEPLPAGERADVEEVPYDAVRDVRLAWNEEDFPGQDHAEWQAQAKEVSLALGARVLALREDGRPVGFAQVEGDAKAAEITRVYVDREHRGGGRGTALTRAAVEAAADIEDLWIVADDEDRPKGLYARLGFRPAWTTVEFLRFPRPAG